MRAGLSGKNAKKSAPQLRRALLRVIVSDSLVQAEPLVELRDPAAGVHQLLLAGEEGVTLRADFHLDILLGRTCLNHITAGACNRSLLIIGMDSFLHCSVHPFLKRTSPHSFHHNSNCQYSTPVFKLQAFSSIWGSLFSGGCQELF